MGRVWMGRVWMGRVWMGRVWMGHRGRWSMRGSDDLHTSWVFEVTQVVSQVVF